MFFNYLLPYGILLILFILIGGFVSSWLVKKLLVAYAKRMQIEELPEDRILTYPLQ